MLLDQRTREYVVAADPVGVEPLYWAETHAGRVVAGTSLAEIVDRPDVDATPDYEGVLLDQGGPLLRGPDTATRTSFRAVARIPGGHLLRVRPHGRHRLQRYWDPEQLPGPDQAMGVRECAANLRDAVVDSVRRLTPVDAAVGAHVSGGLDCTSIACCADRHVRAHGSGIVAGYSWAPDYDVVPPFEGDERDLLRDVSASTGIPVRMIGSDDSDEWFWELDPLRYPNTDHHREAFVLDRARKDGVEVMLSGWGGDEFSSFNGRTVIRQLLRAGRPMQAWRQYGRATQLAHGEPQPLARRARGFVGQVRAASPLRRGRTSRGLRTDSEDWRIEVDARLRAHYPLAADLVRRTLAEQAKPRDHHEMQLFLLANGHLQRRIAGWHQTGLLMGVRYRYPLLDLGVVTAALSMPWRAFLSDGWSRPAFRLAVEPWVPASVAWNVTKHEPALFWPQGGGGIDLASATQRYRHLNDPEYQAVLQLIRMMRQLYAQPRSSVPPRVESRPDLALRVDS